MTHLTPTVESREHIVPIAIPAGDPRILINGKPPIAACRVLAEDEYQMLFAAFEAQRHSSIAPGVEREARVRSVPQSWVDRAMQIEAAASGLVSMVNDAIQRAQEGSGRLYAANIVQMDAWSTQVLEAIALPEPVFADALLSTPPGVEREASVAEEWNAYMNDAVSNAPEPLRQLGKYLAGVLDEDKWKTAERYLNAALLSTPRPSQVDTDRAIEIGRQLDAEDGGYPVPGTPRPADGALNGYRAAVSYIGADSWDGCSDCIDILKAARAADTGWDWASDADRVARELAAIRPFIPDTPRPTAPEDARRAVIEECVEVAKQMSAEWPASGSQYKREADACRATSAAIAALASQPQAEDR